MSDERILLIEDEPDAAEVLMRYLERDGFKVTWSKTGKDGLKQARRVSPDLLLLDLMLPDQDGMDLFRQFKTDPLLSHVPVIIVTAKVEDQDVLVGLHMGAEDYVTKPCNPKILVARVRNVLRRLARAAEGSDALSFGALRILPARHEALIHGERLDLTPTEFALLQQLASNPARVLSRDELVAFTRERGGAAQIDRNIDVHITHLRHKLGELGDLIETVRGVGYRLGRAGGAGDRVE